MAIIFGSVISGLPALLYNVFILMLLPMALAFGLWWLKEVARLSSIGYFVYGLVNSATAYMSPNISAAAIQMNSQAHLPEITWTASAVTSVALGAAATWFLVTRRQAFQKSRRPSEATP